VRGLAVPQGGAFSRGQLDKLTELAKRAGAKGLVWIKSENDGTLASPVAKFFSAEKLAEMFKAVGAASGDCALVVADEFDTACAALSTLRLHLGKELNLIDTSSYKFLWVVDFPLLEYSPDEKRWVARHHPFTSPKDEFAQDLVGNNEAAYGKMLAKAYDLVMNGYEVGGGSIRIHSPVVQSKVFKVLGLDEELAKSRFGFLLDALKFGAPPHGGIALGIDRWAMMLAGTTNIRDVIAFPKNAKARDLMTGAPAPVDLRQLKELGL
jgi:aspartyl-tRNA synthetase